MTTIVFDGTRIAVDTLVTCGGRRMGHLDKIHSLEDGSYFVYAGDMARGHQLLEHVRSGGELPKVQSNDTVEALHVRADKSVVEMDEHGRTYPAVVPWFGGSGGMYAKAAMASGSNVVEAVEIAIELDCYSGGAVQVVEVFSNEQLRLGEI